jgi:hypothetical protein
LCIRSALVRFIRPASSADPGPKLRFGPGFLRFPRALQQLLLSGRGLGTNSIQREANSRSTRLIQDADVGVKCSVKRRNTPPPRLQPGGAKLLNLPHVNQPPAWLLQHPPEPQSVKRCSALLVREGFCCVATLVSPARAMTPNINEICRATPRRRRVMVIGNAKRDVCLRQERIIFGS